MPASPPPIAALFHALADPARLAMVERLSRGPCSVGELAAPLPMTLAAALQHVQVLEKSGLIATEKVGRSRLCRLAPDGLPALQGWLDRHGAGHADADRAMEGEPALPQPRRARHHPQFRKAAQRLSPTSGGGC
jgi:DNA-binding transcriptional ArsR family regulator